MGGARDPAPTHCTLPGAVELTAPTLPGGTRARLGETLGRLSPLSRSAPGRVAVLRIAAWAMLLAATGLAASLRLSEFSSVAPNPYYDAAVRSMALSWHNFLLGAFEPGGSVAIDKPPVDLWLQVASVKLLGFGSSQLRLPAALAGTAAVPLLFAVLRPASRLAAGIGALALAVLPIAVLTDRSDTMDSLSMALDVLAAWLVLRAGRSRSIAPLIAAGAVMGLAFNVKLFEALIPLPALVVLYLIASRERPLVRLGALTAAGATLLAVSLAWLALFSLTPASSRPFAIGSTHGSAWESTFVFNGVSRLDASRNASPKDRPGADRLVRARGRRYLALVGAELIPALALGALAATGAGMLAARRRGLDDDGRSRRALAAAFAVWLLTGTAILSAMRQLHPRYVEVIAPAVAGCLGLGIAGLTRQAWRRDARGPAGTASRGAVVVAVAAAVAALLWGPLHSSIDVVRARSSDSGRPGALEPAQVARLSAYLRRHTRRRRYEVATASAVLAGPLIAHDGRPVLVLTTVRGRRIVSARTLARDVRRKEVRYALLTGTRCKRGSRRAMCSGALRWARKHGVVIPARRTGLPRRLVLVRLSSRAQRGALSATGAAGGARRRSSRRQGLRRSAAAGRGRAG